MEQELFTKEELNKLSPLIIWASEFQDYQTPWDIYCERADVIMGRVLSKDERIELMWLAVLYRNRDAVAELTKKMMKAHGVK